MSECKWVADYANYNWYRDEPQNVLETGCEPFDTELEAVEAVHASMYAEYRGLKSRLGASADRVRELRAERDMLRYADHSLYTVEIVEEITESREVTVASDCPYNAALKAYDLWMEDAMIGPDDVVVAVNERDLHVSDRTYTGEELEDANATA